MRAYQIARPDGIDSLKKVDLPEPKPSARQVLVKVGFCSLNYRDLSILLGRYRMPVRPNLIPLSDGAGTVVAVGADVTQIKIGDRVAGSFFQKWPAGLPTAATPASALGGTRDGMLAEYVVLEEDGAVHIPEGLSLEEAATLPCAAVTAWHALVEYGRIFAGQSVLVQGTGGVSIFALQFAQLMGAQVIVTSSSDAKLARAKELGATHGINYKNAPEWDKAVLELTGGKGVDQVVEVGGAGTFARSLNAICIGGKVSLIGVLTGATESNPLMILSKRANVQGISVGSTQSFEAMNRAIAAAGLKPVIDRIFSFDDVPAAFHHLQSGAHFGKIVLSVA